MSNTLIGLSIKVKYVYLTFVKMQDAYSHWIVNNAHH